MQFHIGHVTFCLFSACLLSCCLHSLSGQPPDLIKEDHASDSMVMLHMRNCQFEKALLSANNRLKRTSHDPGRKAHWLMRTANIYYSLGDMRSGNETLESVRQIMQNLRNPGHQLQFHFTFLQGRSCYYGGDNRRAVEWYRQAELHSVFLHEKHPGEMAWLYGETGYMFYKLNDYAASIRYFQRAINAIPGNSPLDLHEATRLKARMADACWNNKKMDEAVNQYQDCMEYLDTIADPLHPALMDVYLILNNYTSNFFDNYTTTKKIQRNATLILEKFFPRDHYYAGILYTKKAQLEYSLSNFENALQYGQHALQILSKYQFLDQYKKIDYLNIARVYYWLERDYKKTIDFSEQAIDSLQGTGVSPADLYFMIGLSCVKLNNRSAAVESLNKVISLTADNKKYPDNYNSYIAYQMLGNIYLSQGDPVTGRRYLFTALTYARRISEKGYAVTSINRELGNSYFVSHDYQRALYYLQQSLIAGCNTFKDTSVYANPVLDDIVIALNLIRTLTDKAYTFYQLYEKEGKPIIRLENALLCQELAVRLIEKRVVDIDEERSGLILSDIRTRAMNNAVSYAVLLYLRTRDSQYADKAWEYAEKSKMQVFSIHSMKKDNMLIAGLPDSLIRKQENLNHDIRSIENQLALDENNQNTKASKSKALAKLAALYDQRNELAARFEKDYPSYNRLKYRFTVAGMEQLQKLLEEDQVIVEYQILSTEIITFVITKNEYFIYFTLIDKEVPDAINQLRTAVTSGPFQSDPMVNFQTFVESSYYLYTRLIEPIYDKIQGKRLILVPHNLITQVPFEALIREKPEKGAGADFRSLKYLVREFPISYAFSANLLIDKDHRKYGSETAIFFPDYGTYKGKDSLLLPLEGAGYESRKIRKLTGGRLYQRDKADESTFKARAHRYRILHMATHAVMDETNPDLSYLIMSAPVDTNEDGNLYSYEISRMKLKAQLVVLSGCNTGYGLLRRSEGLISIARSFLYTGIRTVAYTLWPMADRAGSDLVSSFYKGLRQGQTLDKAMRTAKLSFLENTDPVYAHPFYWAGYVVAGRTDPIPVFRLYFWIIVFGSSIVAIMLAFFLYKKIRT